LAIGNNFNLDSGGSITCGLGRNISLRGSTKAPRNVEEGVGSVSDPVETTPAPRDSDAHLADQIEASFDAKRKELGVADELKDIPGVTTLMLVAFGERGIKTIDDLAGCATDDLCGWIEDTSGTVTRHEGILHRFNVSRGECDAMIMFARIKAGWI
jgi:predicted flap endonuclease-1-like 5' DNA nuclease